LKNLQDCYTLKNGVKVPCIGYGTWKSPIDVVREGIKMATATGYRHIDTAAAYQNEIGVGQGIKQCGFSKDKLFVTSKLPNLDHGYKKAISSCEESLKRLDMDYLDLYLIHWPVVVQGDYKEDILETWRAFEQLYKEGKVRAIGVSNFLIEHLELIKKNASVFPMVNQVQLHPQNPQEDMVEYCNKNQILVEAWSPLIQGDAFKRELLKDMAKKYNQSIAQICVRWIMQKGVVPLPKSTSIERIQNNVDVFNFNISNEDMEKIATLRSFGMIGESPSIPRVSQNTGF